LQSEKNGKEFYKAKVLEIYQTLEITKDREDISEKRKAEIISNKLLLMEDYVAKYDTIDSELSKLSDKFDNEIIKIRNMIKQSVPELSDDDVTAYIEKYIIKFD
jgi:seryl-tRNA synthetase